MRNIKYIVIVALALAIGVEANAQSIYEANRFMGSDLNGTARFVGMGGAMGALGGDISTMNTNPAGIGIYRSNDLMMSFGFNATNADSKFGTESMNANKLKLSFDNIGFVYSNKIGNLTALKYVNFGFNYHKQKNFNKSMLMGGNFGNVSQTNQFAMMCNRPGDGSYFSEILDYGDLTGGKAFTYNDVPWLGAMAAQANLINPYYVLDDNGNKIPQIDNGKPVLDKDGNPVYLMDYLGYLPLLDKNVNGKYNSKEKGGVDAFDFNVSFNINDMLYLGATISAYSVNYLRTSEYSESFYLNDGDDINDGFYTLRNRFKTEGAGVDFKLGMIIRPIPSSPLRIGLAIHTPTFYYLTDRNTANLDFDTRNESTGEFVTGTTYPKDNAGQMEGETKYQLRTPWKYNFSLGYTIGKSVAIGAEYEYEDRSAAKMKYEDGDSYYNMDYENSMIKDMLKGVHTVRLGVEAKLVPEFALRAGYNYITGAFDNNAYKQMPNNTIYTSTEYANSRSINNYTIGMGYRGSMFYADLAYQFSTYKEDFYAFDNIDLVTTKVNNYRSQVLFTLGMRF